MPLWGQPNPETLLAQAKMLFEQGRLPESEAAFRKVIASKRFVAEALYSIGVIRLAQGDLNNAIAQLQEALHHDPRHANALYQLGFIAEQQGLWDNALSFYKQALASNPQHLAAQQKLAQLGSRYPQAPMPMNAAAPPYQLGALGSSYQPSQQEIKELFKARKWGNSTIGRAYDVRQRLESQNRFAVLTFRVDPFDKGGKRMPTVQVEIRASYVHGTVQDGDWVEVPAKRDKDGTAERVYNLTTRVEVWGSFFRG